MRRITWRDYWLSGLILALTSPVCMADPDGWSQRFDQDERGHRSNREKDPRRSDGGHPWKNNWMNDHRDDHDRWKEHEHHKPERNYFDSDDRRYLHSYYHDYDRYYWASHNAPPGLLKQLRRHKPLPPGLRTYLVPFPVEVEQHLCPVPRNCVRFMICGRGVILDAQLNVVDLFDLH